MSETLVHIEGAPRPRMSTREIVRIALNLAAVCALGGVVLGAVYLGTVRYQAAARLASERTAVGEMLGVAADVPVTEVAQELDPVAALVLYHAKAFGREGAPAHTLAFTLEGEARPAPADDPVAAKRRVALGRLFYAGDARAPLGFVLEGETRGYKNRIRFFVALDSAFAISGVRVLEHEEDPGLGAEVATAWFQRQFLGRDARTTSTLTVTRDPLPEDWRAALTADATVAPQPWSRAHTALIARERTQPVHAVTGATISSRALTDGVRVTLDHFRRRWALLAPALEGAS